MMMNFLCGMVDRRKAFSLISSWDHCQRSSPLQISNKSQAGFEPAQNLSSAFLIKKRIFKLLTMVVNNLITLLFWTKMKIGLAYMTYVNNYWITCIRCHAFCLVSFSTISSFLFTRIEGLLIWQKLIWKLNLKKSMS